MSVTVYEAGRVDDGEVFRLYDLSSMSALSGLGRVAKTKERQIIINDDGCEKTAAICPGLSQEELVALQLEEVTQARHYVGEALGIQMPTAEVVSFPVPIIESTPEAA